MNIVYIDFDYFCFGAV